eukprot:PITA_06597
MNNVLCPYLDKFVIVFIDDILIYSKNEEDLVNHLAVVLRFLREHQLYAKISKCNFFQAKVHYLGHVVSKEGIVVDPEKVRAIMEWASPKNVDERKGKKFEWTKECAASFEQLKQLLTNVQVLKILDPDKEFEVCTYACKRGLGGVLVQEGQVEQEGEFQAEPQCILQRKQLMLRNKAIKQVKVQWKNFGPEEATWEIANQKRVVYPSLFFGGGKAVLV